MLDEEGNLKQKELFEEIRIARVASLVALAVSLMNIFVICFYSWCVFNQKG